jgi:hypothetical protein
MLDLLYEAWRDDTRAGRRSLMIANDLQTVLDLNNRARADRIAVGQVRSDGVETANGSVVGVGDSVVTRRNQRGLATGQGWVKNGDQWSVVRVRRDGRIDVRRLNGTGRATLPADYVREHVELGYATTAHRAQGRTVDTAHAFVSATTVREPLYVMATRGRESNQLYVDTMYDPDVDTSHETPDELTPAHVLRHVLANSGADKSATLTITDEWAHAHSITRLWAEYETIARRANENRYAALVAGSGLTPAEAATVRASQAWGPLMTAFGEAEARGLDLDRAVPALVQGRTINGANDIAALIHGRVTKWIKSASYRRPADLLVGLFPAVNGVTDRDVDQGLQERLTLIEQNARTLVLEALQRRDPWILGFGRPPADPVRLEDWLRQLDTIVAYRDRYQISGNAILGVQPQSREPMAQRQAGHRAVSAGAGRCADRQLGRRGPRRDQRFRIRRTLMCTRSLPPILIGRPPSSAL